VWQTQVSDASLFAMPHTSLSCVFVFRPCSPTLLSSAAFVGASRLMPDGLRLWPILVGCSANSVLELHSPIHESPQWAKTQEIVLQSLSRSSSVDQVEWTNLVIDPNLNFVIVANMNETYVNVLHIENSGFDRTTKWDIDFPIISFVPVTLSKADSQKDESELQV